MENFCVVPVFLFSFSKDLKFVIDTRRQVMKRSCHTSAVFNCLKHRQYQFIEPKYQTVFKFLWAFTSPMFFVFCRFTYSDLCVQVPEPKLRPCLLRTLECLFSLMCSYYAIMSFSSGDKVHLFFSVHFIVETFISLIDSYDFRKKKAA